MDFNAPLPLNQAVEILRKKDLLPTNLSTADLRDMSQEVRQLSLYSARTTSLRYLEQVKTILSDLASGKINAAEARTRCKEWLQLLGYNEQTHFGTDADKAIAPAEKGSLLDLASDARLNLMLKTNLSLLFNGGFMQAGLDVDRRRLFPAWELVRIYEREHPRGSTDKSDDIGWKERWVRAGGTLVGGRMIALKSDPIWQNLGDSSLFSDGTDSTAPPYWFNSGGGIREVSRAECIAVGLISGGASSASPTKIDRSLIGKFFQDPDKATLANLKATRADLQAAVARLEAA